MHPSSGTIRVCGSVIVDPVAGSTVTTPGSYFATPNCGGGPSLQSNVATAQAEQAAVINAYGIDCSRGFEDACGAIETYRSCLRAAVNLALAGASIPNLGDGSDVAELTVEAAGDLMSTSSRSSVASFGSAVSGITKVVSAVGILRALVDANRACH